MGPLVDAGGFEMMQNALNRAKTEGGDVIGGERVAIKGLDNGFYVKPSIVKMPKQTSVVKDETFAPILYVMGYKDIEEAIHLQNDVPQGLSSCIFTNDNRVQRPSGSCRRQEAIAGSRTSISVRAAPRSVGRLAARRRPAAVASPAPTRGATTCVARRTR